jgi:hypothetical protein
MTTLSRKTPAEELFSQDKHIHMLQNWIKAKGYETMGPLIMHTGAAQEIDDENNPIIDSRLMVQLKNDAIRLEPPYHFEKEIRIENCLLVRFNDNPEKLQFATMKMQVFAYENDIELTGETYMILIEQKENKLLADVFMPIKSAEQILEEN